MKCQGRLTNYGIIGKQCRRKAIIGIFCHYHIDYIQKLKRLSKGLKEELKRIKQVRKEYYNGKEFE